MFKTSIIFVALLLSIYADEDDGSMENDDKLILNPADLADLVLKERIKTELQNAVSSNKYKNKHDNSLPILSGDDSDMANIKIEETDDDAATLKLRKVWSRWSKWGECSVSCGEGFMVRQRACVAGRCARGEREEQRRPCRRTPCPALPQTNKQTTEPE